jgi:hypothetical protein
MRSHDNRVRDEFARQAETFSASAAITAALGLEVDGRDIRFFHRWNLIVARKPA